MRSSTIASYRFGGGLQQPLAPGGGALDIEPVIAECRPDLVRRLRVVLDDEHSGHILHLGVQVRPDDRCDGRALLDDLVGLWQ